MMLSPHLQKKASSKQEGPKSAQPKPEAPISGARLLKSLSLRSFSALVDLCAADGTPVLRLKPLFDAVGVELVEARQG